MFRKPTVRSQRIVKPNRHFFTDCEPMPMNAGHRGTTDIAADPSSNRKDTYGDEVLLGNQDEPLMPGDAASVPGMSASVSPSPTGDPSSTSEGSDQPPFMQRELMAQFPVDGARMVYWPTAIGSYYIVNRKEVDGTDSEADEVGRWPQNDSYYYWCDVTTDAFRVWRTTKAVNDLANTRPGLAAGRAAAAAIGDRAAKIRAINARNAAFWKRS